jgi:competence protein CoiA
MNVLVANRENNERLSLGDSWEKKELMAIRSKENFHCPECNEQVIMKLGSKRIWHFSHLPGSSCEYQYDRESAYHLSGKLQLYNWLKQQGINAELEKYDPEAKQKPDITCDWQGKKYAIEFQSSIIPEELFVKRTRRYFENGYIPIWIAAGNLIKRTGTYTIALNNFLYLFIRRPGHHWHIPVYCPLSGQFIDMNGVIPITSRKIITQLDVHSIQNVSVDHLLFPLHKKYPKVKTWHAELQKFKSRYTLYPGSYQNPFLRELYHNRLNLLNLPPEIGLPVQSSPFVDTPAAIWQTYLYLDVFRYKKEGDLVTFAQVINAFTKRVKRGQIMLRSLPLAENIDYTRVVFDYVLLLTKISVLDQLNESRFKVNRKIYFSTTMEEQRKTEDNFYRKYGNMIEAALI